MTTKSLTFNIFILRQLTMSKFLTLIGGVVVLVSGCYSFNTYNIKDTGEGTDALAKNKTITTNTPVSLISTAHATPVPLQLKPSCPPFILPPLPPTPPLPHDELVTIDSNDDAAIDSIQQKHIEDLRNYIVKVKQTIITAQRDYNEKCGLTNNGK